MRRPTSDGGGTRRTAAQPRGRSPEKGRETLGFSKGGGNQNARVGNKIICSFESRLFKNVLRYFFVCRFQQFYMADGPDIRLNSKIIILEVKNIVKYGIFHLVEPHMINCISLPRTRGTTMTRDECDSNQDFPSQSRLFLRTHRIASGP